MKKLLLFGAGKIGRSFMAQIFSIDGYEIVFVDISQDIVDEINLKGRYPVYIKDKDEVTIWVDNIRALHSSQKSSIVNEILETNYIAISVGKNGLSEICLLLAEGISKKYENDRLLKTDIILAENLRNGDEFLFNELGQYLSVDFPLREVVGIQETSIGKMVPIIPEEIEKDDILAVYAEAYNSLIVSSNFKNGIPKVKSLSPKDNIKAWVDRKLFIHNLGHAFTAYVGNYIYPEKKYIYEILEDKKIERLVVAAMHESAAILSQLYPGEFSVHHLRDHISNLVDRFKNRALGDTVYRVGCDLKRKLSHDDRFVTPLRNGIHFNLKISTILYGYCCALYFSARSESGEALPSDHNITNDFKSYGVEYIQKNYSEMNPENIFYTKNEIQQITLMLDNKKL